MENSFSSAAAELIYYTDPLCCWSWAMHPHLAKCKKEFEGRMSVRLCMGGLLPSWQQYHDTVYNVSRPVQMGPVWMEAANLTGAKINNRIWIDDPPSSSYLSCIAVKCAGLQSAEAEAIYLHALQKAVMVDGINISFEKPLVLVAEKMNSEYGLLNMAMFKDDLRNGRGLEAFRGDLNEVQINRIARFPTIILKSNVRGSLMIVGYRPYEVLVQTVERLLARADSEKENVNKQDV
jgi:putative protein-disulfide isomerase